MPALFNREQLDKAFREKLSNCELTDDQLLFVINEEIKDYQRTFGLRSDEE